MVGLKHRSMTIAVGLAAALAMPGATTAQCRLCATPTTVRANPTGNLDVTLEVETSLTFGRLLLSGEGRGSASVNPDGTTSASGAITMPAARVMAGSVTVRGEPGRAVRVELPQRATLYSLDGSQIQIRDMQSDLAGYPRLDGTGKLTFRFGGRIEAEGDVDGEFRGDLPITVEYL